jgi:hypothetical protein
MAEASEGQSAPLSSLSDVFSSDPAPADNSASDAGDGKKDEGKDEGDQKFPVSASSDEKDDSPDEKSDEKDEKSEKPSPDAKKDAGKLPDAKSDSDKEGKPSGEEGKDATPPKDKWESDDNPYVKRFKDTAANWNKTHQENLQLRNAVAQMQQEVSTLKKIADGTYDPEKDGPKQPSPQDIAGKALNVGKVMASRNAAIEQFGAEQVETDLNEFNTVFDGNEMVNQLVVNSDAPVYEAFRILKRYRFEKKYGNSPDEWHKNIRVEAEKELREKLRAELTEEILGRADKQKRTPRGLSSSRGSNGLPSGQNSKGKGPTTLKEVFGR